MTYILKETIAIITRWGAGKSSLIEMIIKELEDTGKRSNSLPMKEQLAENNAENEDSKDGNALIERINALIDSIYVLSQKLVDVTGIDVLLQKLQKFVDAFGMKMSGPIFFTDTIERITTLLKKLEDALDLRVNIRLLVYSVIRIFWYWCICFWYSGYSD